VNGAHDVGGMHGHGPVTVEHDEPVFHCAWERRMFALSIACGAHGRWNIDIVRSAREHMLPGDYLTTTYYEHWLFGLERVAVERGLVTAEELATGLASSAADSKRTLRAENVEPAMRKGRSSQIDVDVLPRFAKGDAVVARNIHPSGYTRLPRYARDMTDTDDLVQEALIGTFRNFAAFEHRGEWALQAYLRRAVTNRIRDELRRVEAQPHRTELPDDTSNGPHFFYGLQWWFFGALAVFGFFYLLWDEFRRRRDEPDHPLEASERAQHPAVHGQHRPADER